MTNLPFVAIVAFLLTISSCRSPQKEENPQYFDLVFNSFDSSNNIEAVTKLDAEFNAFPQPGVIDKAKKYIHKSLFYLQRRTHYQEALTCTDSLVKLLEKRKDEPLLTPLFARAFFLKGDAYFGMLNYDKAFENFVTGKNVLSKSRQNNCNAFEYTARIASLLFTQGKFLQAVPYYKQVCSELLYCWKPTFEQFAELQGNLDNVGIAYSKAGLYDSAIHYFDSALTCIRDNKKYFPANSAFMKLAKAVIYSNKAEVLGKQKKINKAEKLFIESSLVTYAQDKFYTLSTLTGLGNIYIQNNQFRKADSLLRKISPMVDSFPLTSAAMAYYKTRTDYYTSVKDTANAFITMLKFNAVKDTVENRKRQFRDMNVKSEFEASEQKVLNNILQKDNQIKTTYLVISVTIGALGFIILMLVLQNLKKKASHVKQLMILNTKVRQSNEDLQKAFISLEESHKENNRITRLVAHDLRNPISAINNLAYAILKKDVPEAIKESLEFIREACINSMSLIKDILDQEKKAQKMQAELTDMEKLLEYCVEMLQHKANEKKQLLKLEADSIMLRINAQKIWRVISNIVNNAIKFSPENTVINVQLKKKNQSSVVLSVHDNGIGIPAHLRDKIFTLDPENRRAGTAGEESHGLGLSIAKKIVEEHKGRIWVESSDGKGAVFFVELPYNN
ncbi:tetratricopeptide repeat-containing sensor histidine kinase [Foetidibacter luteolus]|uniref:tetratricopeptide repeat-containing sensor histidine kinase n=1 Tax=Foetidibacter luteolus TaxID=2608880 RepID=UPI001A97DD59|nr:tetratricopeptide repeat-containing sensor histidine kinase [Foetidibacter luteolus]